MRKRTGSVKRMSVVAMFCALSFVAVLLGKVIPNVAGFLSYDPKDAVVVIAGFLFGPLTSCVIALLVALIEMISISTTGIYGMMMNFLSTAAFAVPAAMLYQKKRSYASALIGLFAGVLFMCMAMVFWNYLITPLYMGVPRGEVAAMLIPVFLPFNLIKGGINAGLTLVLYKPLVSALRRTRLIEASEGSGSASYRPILIWCGLACLACFVIAFLFFSGVLG